MTHPAATLAPLTGPAVDAFRAAAVASGADPDCVDAAVDVVATRRPLLVAFSGWPGAGKDVLGETVVAALGAADTADHLYFAVPLKTEADAIIAACRGVNPTVAVKRVAAEQQVDAAAAELAVGIIWDDAQDPATTARSRTTAARALLQRWGTDVRRAQHPDYWVHQALRPAVASIAAGRAVYVTDVRFPNEVDGAGALGFETIRLDISSATVSRRLAERDGLHLDDATLADMLAFPSESSLNDHDGFALRFDNEGTVADAVAVITAHLRDRAGLTTSTAAPAPAGS
jgi:hypothetical protein